MASVDEALSEYLRKKHGNKELAALYGDIYFLWRFWNLCNLSKYQPRLIISHKIKGFNTFRGIFKCDKCGEYMVNYHISGEDRYCFRCANELKEERLLTERQKIRLRGEELRKQFDDGLCGYGDLCSTLKAHKDLLTNDDQRLKTDFILEQINLAYENKSKEKRGKHSNVNEIR